MTGKVAKYMMAPLSKPFDPIGSWRTQGACVGVAEAGGLVLSSVRLGPRWDTRYLVWKIDRCRCGSVNRSCALARRKRRLVGPGFRLGLGGGCIREGVIAFVESYYERTRSSQCVGS
jgi:hypothetical protein